MSHNVPGNLMAGTRTARAKLRVPHDNEPGPRVREDVDETKRKLEAKRLPLFGES
jgi:hypothetical protein